MTHRSAKGPSPMSTLRGPIDAAALRVASQGADARRGAALARALPRRPRRGQVRRQRDGRRRAQGGVRAGRRVPALRRAAPGRRARRRPADQGDARPARPRQRVQGRPAGHHPRGHGRRADGAHRPGRARARRPAQPARPDGRRALRRGCRAVRRRAAVASSSTARSTTSAWSATSCEVDPTAVLDLLEAGRIPVVSTIAPDLDVDGQVLNVNADTAAAALAVALGARKLVVLTDVEGVYARLARPRLAALRSAVAAARELLHTVDAGMVPKLEACIRAVKAGCRRRTSSTAASRTPAARGLHLRGHRHHGAARTRSRDEPWPVRCPEHATAAWLDRYAGALLPVRGRPQLVLEHGDGAGSGTSRAGATSTWSAASPSTPSATTTRPWSRRCPSRPPAGARVELLHLRAAGRARRAAAALAGAPAGSRGVLLQLRRRGHRGRDQAGPPHRAHRDRRRRGRLPRPHHRRPGAHPQAGLPRAVRAAHPRGHPRALGRRRRPARRRHRADLGASCSSRSRARRACHPAARHTCGRPARSPAGAGRCSCSTRCRPASAAPATGSPSSRPGSSPTP